MKSRGAYPNLGPAMLCATDGSWRTPERARALLDALFYNTEFQRFAPAPELVAEKVTALVSGKFLEGGIYDWKQGGWPFARGQQVAALDIDSLNRGDDHPSLNIGTLEPVSVHLLKGQIDLDDTQKIDHLIDRFMDAADVLQPEFAVMVDFQKLRRAKDRPIRNLAWPAIMVADGVLDPPAGVRRVQRTAGTWFMAAENPFVPGSCPRVGFDAVQSQGGD